MPMIATQPPSTGALSVVKRSRDDLLRAEDARIATLRRELVTDGTGAYFRPRREALLQRNIHERAWRQHLLAWLRDHIHAGIPRWYYQLVLGHDLHLSTYAQLFIEHFHATERDPFTDAMGWREEVGLVSCGKVTTAFRDFSALMLVTDATTIGDFKFHRPGTSATAEANTDTALIADAGLEATGNQTNPTAPTYQSVATVTADTTETWQEHSLRNATGASGGTMLDRSVLSPTVATVNLDTVTFTYVLTLSAEA